MKDSLVNLLLFLLFFFMLINNTCVYSLFLFYTKHKLKNATPPVQKKICVRILSTFFYICCMCLQISSEELFWKFGVGLVLKISPPIAKRFAQDPKSQGNFP